MATERDRSAKDTDPSRRAPDHASPSSSRRQLRSNCPSLDRLPEARGSRTGPVPSSRLSRSSDAILGRSQDPLGSRCGTLRLASEFTNVSHATPVKRTGKSMSRRTGQSGHIEASGKWWVVRWWMDVPGQENGPADGRESARSQGWVVYPGLHESAALTQSSLRAVPIRMLGLARVRETGGRGYVCRTSPSHKRLHGDKRSSLKRRPSPFGCWSKIAAILPAVFRSGFGFGELIRECSRKMDADVPGTCGIGPRYREACVNRRNDERCDLRTHVNIKALKHSLME
jgi:hypothetical protein